MRRLVALLLALVTLQPIVAGASGCAQAGDRERTSASAVHALMDHLATEAVPVADPDVGCAEGPGSEGCLPADSSPCMMMNACVAAIGVPVPSTGSWLAQGATPPTMGVTDGASERSLLPDVPPPRA